MGSVHNMGDKNSLVNSKHKEGSFEATCDKSPFTKFVNGSLNQHIKSFHGIIRTHICGECGYSANGKLKRQIEAVHKKV